jgi:hydroxymethylglutaryl-CoA reductase
MNQHKGFIEGFSKLNRLGKLKALKEHFNLKEEFEHEVMNYLHPAQQHVFDDISENTISNFYLPFGVAPNFLINGEWVAVPMVIEESSVVAAASKAARFWAQNGGFSATVADVVKVGQIHFEWFGNKDVISGLLPIIEQELNLSVAHLTERMRQRGGGIIRFQFLPVGEAEHHLWQLQVHFKTGDSMGANFINSCLETMAPVLVDFLNRHPHTIFSGGDASVIMSILSNFTPECFVTCQVECNVERLLPLCGDMDAKSFAHKFSKAVQIAHSDPYRAATHNKGIFNGIDAVVLATGNDFRAVEANGHVYASASGQYRSLTRLQLENNRFVYTLELPLALGTVGGLTNLHPMARAAFELMKFPSAEKLMMIAAAAGLANNFMAVTSLITSGIQKGHMKLHLANLLATFHATPDEKEIAEKWFHDKTVSYSLVHDFLVSLRNS